MRILRRIVFYIFCLTYLVLCPVLVLSSLGYVFSPRSQEMMHTGLVALATVPRDAVVYLGKSRYAYRTPTVLNDLIPGNYSIRITKKDYLPWEHTVRVEAGRAIAFDKILLVPGRWGRRELAAGPLKTFIPIAKTDFIICARGDHMDDYFIHDIDRERTFKLVPAYYLYHDARVAGVFTVPESPVCVLAVEVNRVKRYLWIRLREKKPRVLDVTMLIPENTTAIVWDPDEDNRLLCLNKGGITRVDVQEKAVYPGYVPQARALGVSNKAVLFIGPDDNVRRVRHDKGGSDVVSDILEASGGIAAGGEVTRVESLGPAGAAVLFTNGTMLISRGERVRLFEDVTGARYDRESKQLLMWNKNSVSVIDMSAPEEPQEYISEGADMQAQRVYQSAKQIEECLWVYDGNHFIARGRDEAVLVEIVPQGESHVNALGQIKRDMPVSYSEDTGGMYFIDRDLAGLCRIDLTPRKQFLPLSRPKQQDAKDDE